MMEIIANRNQLSSCLQKIQSILEKSSSLNNSENILLQTNENELQIIAFDQNCSARGSISAEIKKSGTISLNGRKIYDLVRSLSDEKIIILQNSETSLISIEDSKSSFKILSADIEEFPEIDFKIPELSMTIESDNLIQLIDLTIFSIAKISDPRYNLQGVFLEIDPLNGLSEEDSLSQGNEINLGSHLFSLIATDGHRVAVARTDQIAGRINLGERKIFSRKSLLEIKSVFGLSETLKLGFENNEVVVRGEGFVLILRMLQGDFPDYRKMIPEHFIHHLVMDRNSLLSTVRQMNLLAQEHYRGVFMEFSVDGLKISIDNPEMGHGHTDLPLDYQGDPILIGFNINYLLDFLQAVPDEKIVLQINDKTQPCVIRGEKHEDFMCGIMPIS
ncbi:MAG: DNA polymerase III subunit beta [Deltaproteobacteria bacterium]|nr:DNA polymerase III subunit beta [Candidatus Tharpella aukensis]